MSNLHKSPLPRTTTPTTILQTTFGAIAALTTVLALAFALWKFQGKFRAHYHRRRRQRQRAFELEAQLPQVRVIDIYVRG